MYQSNILKPNYRFDFDLSFVLWNEVDFIEHYNEFLTGDFSDDETFGRLSLNSFGRIDHQQHQIDYLSTTNDCPKNS